MLRLGIISILTEFLTSWWVVRTVNPVVFFLSATEIICFMCCRLRNYLVRQPTVCCFIYVLFMLSPHLFQNCLEEGNFSYFIKFDFNSGLSNIEEGLRNRMNSIFLKLLLY